METPTLCGMCLTEKAGWKCVECEQHLCNNCKVTHLRVPTCHDHQIISADGKDSVLDRLVFHKKNVHRPVFPISPAHESSLCRKRVVTKDTAHDAEADQNSLEHQMLKRQESCEKSHNEKDKFHTFGVLIRKVNIITAKKLIPVLVLVLVVVVVMLVHNSYEQNNQLANMNIKLEGNF